MCRRVIYGVCDLFVCESVCVCVCALKGKWLGLSTLKWEDIQCMAVARHALTLRSKGQRSRSHGYQMYCQLLGMNQATVYAS